MSARRQPRPVVEQSVLVLAGVAAIYFALVPLAPPGGWPTPDLLYCLIAGWVVRHPRSAPLWIVLGLGLFADFMLSRPIGLGTLGLLLTSETLRANAGFFNGAPFVLEWLAAAAGFAAILLGMRVIMELSFLAGPDLPTALRYALSTTLTYPLVAGTLHWGIGLRRPMRAAPRTLGRLR